MCWYDDESEGYQYFTFSDKQDAMKEVLDSTYSETTSQDAIQDLLDNDERVLYTKSWYHYTEKGMTNIRCREDVVSMPLLATLYLESQKDDFDIQGCWWDNILDFSLLSAPAGALFLDCVVLENWKKTPYSSSYSDEEYDDILIPPITYIPVLEQGGPKL